MKLDNLVEGLMRRIQMYKLQEKRTRSEQSDKDYLVRQLQKENKTLKSKCRIYKASIIKLTSKDQARLKSNPKEHKNSKSNSENEILYSRPSRKDQQQQYMLWFQEKWSLYKKGKVSIQPP